MVATETRRMKRKIKDININYEDEDGPVIIVNTTNGGVNGDHAHHYDQHQCYDYDYLFTCWVGHHPHYHHHHPHHHHPHHYDQHQLQCHDVDHLFTLWVGQ